MILVGIAGRARSGKDTMGTALVHHFGYGAKQYSFANALKCYCRVAGLMTVKDGPLLQLVGTDIYRRKEDEFWIRMLRYQIEEEKPNVAIITDCRFHNELAFVRHSHGVLIRMKRFNDDGTEYIDDTRNQHHASESNLTGKNIKWDYDIELHSNAVPEIRVLAHRIAGEISHKWRLFLPSEDGPAINDYSGYKGEF
jgi:hypothetical protein